MAPGNKCLQRNLFCVMHFDSEFCYVLRKCTRALTFSILFQKRPITAWKETYTDVFYFENVEQWEEAQRQKEAEKAAVEEEARRVQKDASAAEYKREQVYVASSFS